MGGPPLVLLEPLSAFLGDGEQKVDWDWSGWDGHHRSMVFQKSTFGANNVLDSDQHKFTGWSIHINVQ